MFSFIYRAFDERFLHEVTKTEDNEQKKTTEVTFQVIILIKNKQHYDQKEIIVICVNV